MVRPPPPSSPPSSGVSVFVRVRNIPTYEKSLTAGFSGGDYDPVANVVRVDGNTVFIADPQPPAAPSADPVPRESDFSFDGVLAEKMTQEAVYDKAVRPLIERCLDGYNGTVFCYGQTASGKTFTMQGPSLRDSKPDEVGIVQRVAKQIIDGLKELGKRVPGFTATVKLSYLEIYNEKLSDLISADSKAKKELKISIDPDSANLKDHYVSGLTEMVVSEVDDYLDVIVMGAERRKVGATDMNAVSSRSHSVLTITIDQRSPISDGGIAKKRSKINLVDLAGSERADSTGATGERLKEGAAINQSLSCLGNVVNALSSGKATHIPYRDSKLTYLLQDSLGGNSLTVMIACVTPTAKNYQESMSTLRFATRVKKGVKNVASLNVDANVLRIIQLEQEVALLQAELNYYKTGSLDGGLMARLESSPGGLQSALAVVSAVRSNMPYHRDSNAKSPSRKQSKVAPSANTELVEVMTINGEEAESPDAEKRASLRVDTSLAVSAAAAAAASSPKSPIVSAEQDFYANIKGTLASEQRVVLVDPSSLAAAAAAADPSNPGGGPSDPPKPKLLMDTPSFRLALKVVIACTVAILAAIIAVVVAGSFLNAKVVAPKACPPPPPAALAPPLSTATAPVMTTVMQDPESPDGQFYCFKYSGEAASKVSAWAEGTITGDPFTQPGLPGFTAVVGGTYVATTVKLKVVPVTTVLTRVRPALPTAGADKPGQ